MSDPTLQMIIDGFIYEPRCWGPFVGIILLLLMVRGLSLSERLLGTHREQKREKPLHEGQTRLKTWTDEAVLQGAAVLRRPIHVTTINCEPHQPPIVGEVTLSAAQLPTLSSPPTLALRLKAISQEGRSFTFEPLPLPDGIQLTRLNRLPTELQAGEIEVGREYALHLTLKPTGQPTQNDQTAAYVLVPQDYVIVPSHYYVMTDSKGHTISNRDRTPKEALGYCAYYKLVPATSA